MIEFRTLGGIEVGGIAPGAGQHIQARSKWIATLALLALPESGEVRRRDEIVSLLWPAADRTRGLASLRVVLHGLRRRLGHTAILSRGAEIRLDRGRLSCDAEAFLRLLSGRRRDEALDVYGGDLLPGLHVRAAPRFNDWLDIRRESLRQGAMAAAWTLSRSAERRGWSDEAVRRARQAVSLSGKSEAAVRRYRLLLDRAGDGAASLREAHAFAERRQEGAGVEPDEYGLTGMDRIVVLPFRVDGDEPAVEHTAAGLAHDIIASLARVSGIVVVARPSVSFSLGALGRVPAAIGRELSADLVLDTSLRVIGGSTDPRFVLVSRLIDVDLERPIWADVFVGNASDLPAMRRQLLHGALAATGLRLTAVEMDSLARGQTSSPKAFGLYLKACSLWGRRSREEIERAIALFEEALSIDPGFALALVGLMDAHAVLHPAAGRRIEETGVLARELGRRALEIEPELGEAHASLGILRGFMDADWTGAVHDLRRAIEMSPGHANAHHWLGAFLTFIWRRLDEGARELEIARQLDPYSPAIRADIGLARLNRGDLDGARKILGNLASEPGFWRAPYYLGVTCFVAGDPESGTRHLHRAWREGAFGATPSDFPPEGDDADWRDTLSRRLERLSTSRLQPGTRAVEAALLSMLLGQREDAIRWLADVARERNAAWIMGFYPVFEPLTDDPGFREFLTEAGLDGMV